MIDQEKPPKINLRLTVNGTPVDVDQKKRYGAAPYANIANIIDAHIKRVGEAARLWAEHFGKRGTP